MVSLFAALPQIVQPEPTPSLHAEIRQMIVDLHEELPTMSQREIAEICAVRFDRKPSHHRSNSCWLLALFLLLLLGVTNPGQ
jgi:hypothetical protein